MEENIKLTEGEYEIAEGCEYVGQKNKKLVIKRFPDVKDCDIVVSEDNRHMGVFRKFSGIESAAYYIDFCYDINYRNEIDVIYFYTNRSNVVSVNLRKANEEETALFYDIIHAYGYDYDSKAFTKVTRYFSKNHKYGIIINEGKLCAKELNGVDENCILGGSYDDYKFETERAAKICAKRLNKNFK